MIAAAASSVMKMLAFFSLAISWMISSSMIEVSSQVPSMAGIFLKRYTLTFSKAMLN